MKTTKRLLAMLMVMTLLLSYLPPSAAAVGPADSAEPAVTESVPPDESTEQTDEIASTNDGTVISLWTYPIGDWGNAATVSALIDQFEADNPGITVEVSCLDYMTGSSTVEEAITNGTAPDLIMEGPELLVANYGERGLMADLSDLLDETDISEIYPNALAAGYGSDGSLYQYPLAGTVHTMAINKTVFEAAGAMQYLDETTHTWNSAEDFFKAVQAVYESTGQSVGMVYCGGQGGDQGTRALVTNLCGGTYTDAGHSHYTWDSAENIAALQALYDCPGIDFNSIFVGGDEISLFLDGMLNMAFCWNVNQQINCGGQTEDGDEIMFVAFPSDTDPQLQGGIWGFGVFDNGDDARIEAAKTFVKYMCDSAATAEAVTATTYFPLRTSAEGTDLSGIWADDTVKIEYNAVVHMLGDYYQVTPNWSDARICWYMMLQDVGRGQNIASSVEHWTAMANNSLKTQVTVLAPAYGSASADWWAAFEEDYEAANQNIDLVVDCVSWNDIYSIMEERIADGNAPDILELDIYEEYLDMLMPVQDYMSEETYAKIYPNFLAESEKDGTVWAVPDLTAARGLYINRDMLETVGMDAPATWAELEAVCAAIRDHYGDEVIPFGLDMSENEGQLAFALAAWNNGGGFLDENGDWALNAQANVEAVEFLIRMYNSGYTNDLSMSRYDIMDRFSQGQVAMMVGPSGWGPACNFEIMPIPANEGCASWSMGIMDRMMCFDNGYSDEELAAVTAFFDMFYDDQRHADWVFGEGFLPATSTGMEQLAQDHDFLAPWAEILPNCKFYPADKAGWGTVRGGVIGVLGEASNGGDVRQLLDDLQAQVTGGGEEEDHAPFLSFRWLINMNGGWEQEYYWMEDGNDWSNGYTGGMGMIPGSEFWQVYYLNTWNADTQSYDATPVHVEVSEQLSKERLYDGDYSFMPGAEDVRYYYRITVLEDTWDQTGIISYTMDDGTELTLEVYISRGEAGFYSTPALRNETYIRDFCYDRINTDENVFYFGFQSEYWTLESVEPVLGYLDYAGYDASDVFTVERVNKNVYKITLTPWAVSLGGGIEVGLNLYLTDSEGNSNNGNWYIGIWCHNNGENENSEAIMDINGQGYNFYRNNAGETVAYSHVFHDVYDNDGNEAWHFEQVDLPEGFIYDLDTNTITLNNVSLEQLHLGYYWVDQDNGREGWNLPTENLTIELIGENSIYSDRDAALHLSDGIHVTITGDGSLYVCSRNTSLVDDNGNYRSYNAINMWNDAHLTIAGNASVTVEIAGEAMESCWDGDTYLGSRPAQVAAIEGGLGSLTLKDNASLTTIVPEGSKVNGPKLENEEQVIWDDWYPGGFRGIRSMGTITVEGGTLDTQEIELGAYWDENGLQWVGSYIQSGGTVNITARGSYGEAEIWEWNEETQEDVFVGIVDHCHYSGLSNYEGGYVEISGGELNIDCLQTGEELASSTWGDGIKLGGDGEMVQSGGTVNVEINRGYAVTVNALTVSGGTLNATSHEGCGVEANNCVISGGTVNAEGRYDQAARAYELTIDGGTFNIRSEEGSGLYSNNIKITDGLLDLNFANGMGIDVWNSFTVEGGTVNLSGKYGDVLNLTDADARITGGTVTVTGEDCLLIGVGGWEDPANYDGSMDGSLTMSGGKLVLNFSGTDTRGMEIRAYGKAIFTGSAQVEMTGGWLDTRGQLNIAEDASLNLTNTLIGVYERGIMTLEGGNITVSNVWNDALEENSIYVERSAQLIINDGKLTVDAVDFCKGIMTEGTYIQNGGEVTVTLTGDRIGYTYHEDTDSYSYFPGFAMSSGGYTTINGGVLNLTAHDAFEQFYNSWDEENPDSRKTKLTVNGGTINLVCEYAGFDINAPAEFNGGTINIHSLGLYIPRYDMGLVNSLLVRHNGYDDPEIASSITINGGVFDLKSDVPGDNYSSYVLYTAYAPFVINGGTISATGGIAMYDVGSEPNLVIADHMNMVSLTSADSKALLGRYVEDRYTDADGNAVTEIVYIATVEEDNMPGDIFTHEGLDECTGLLIAPKACGEDLTWTVENGALTISGTGAMDAYSEDTHAPWHIIRDKITSVTIGSGVSTVADYAFSGCSALTEIRFLGSAPAIGSNAFLGVTATASYYSARSGWTSGVKRNYGGTITWDSIDIVASGWSGDTTWVLTDDGVLTFSGNGNMKNYANKTAMPWYGYFDQITNVVIEEGVTRIGDNAFYGMPKLTAIEIADTVTTIGTYAFKGCPKLDGVVLPDGLTKLGESAFYECTALTSIEIPASLWTIQPYTFKNCTALESVTFHEGNLQKISDGAFYGTALKEVTFPDCLSIIDVYAFKNCADLETINLGSGLTEIREAVFYGTAIPDITIPEGVTKIGPYAFKNCVNLRDVDLPNTLTSVGEASFYACTALESLILPDNVTTIGNYAFRKCTALTTVMFSDHLVTIGESSFYGCTGLTELVIPDSVTTIGGYAFKGCTDVASVTLGDSVATLGDSAFHTCTALKTIVIPETVTAIGEYCFSGSYNLWKITFQGDAPSIGTGAFKGLAATAYYPGGNPTWTSAVMQNYGGAITWKAN